MVSIDSWVKLYEEAPMLGWMLSRAWFSRLAMTEISSGCDSGAGVCAVWATISWPDAESGAAAQSNARAKKGSFRHASRVAGLSPAARVRRIRVLRPKDR